jgi:hypothetical protein
MYGLQEWSSGANSANVNSLPPSWGERDDLPSDTAAIEDGDDEGPETNPRQRLRFVGLGGGLVIVGMVVVAVTYLVNTPAEPSAGPALPQARTGPRDDTGSRPVSSSGAVEATGSPSTEPSVAGSAAAASPSPPSSVGGVSSEPVQPVQPAKPPTVSQPSPAGPPPEAELRAIYSTLDRTGRARLRGQVVVSNVSDTTAAGWQVTIRLPEGGTISNSDGVDFTQTGSTVRFIPRGKTRKIAPGGSVRFTFDVRGSKGGEPTGCFINERPCG